MSRRALVTIPVIALVTLVLGVLAIVAGLVDWRGRLSRALGRAWARCILVALGVDVEIAGAANVPSGPAVYASNHGSALDIPILLARLPADSRILHKRSLYLIPVFGWSLWLAGHVGIDRRNPFRARRSLEKAARLLRAGAALVVFPEGTRSPDARVRPFKRGTIVLAGRAGVPVVPVSLVGVKRVVPRGISTLRPGRVRLTIHPPIDTADRTADGGAGLAEDVRRVVASACEDWTRRPSDARAKRGRSDAASLREGAP